MKKNIITFLLVTFFLSCNSDDSNSEMSNVAVTLISKGELYGAGNESISQQNMVVTDQITWNNLIAQMNTENNVSGGFSETDIDFSAYQVIAVFDDVQPNGGHSIEMNVVSNSENILVNITKTSPEGNATMVVTQPYHIVKIATSDLSIIFE